MRVDRPGMRGQSIIPTAESYTQAIQFEGPDYLPCTLDVNLDWLYDQDRAKQDRIRDLQSQFRDDLHGGLDAALTSKPTLRDGVSRWTDEWGTGWVDDGHGAKTEAYPLIEGYELHDAYTIPDPSLPGRFHAADESLKDRSGRYVRACVWFTLFERLWMVRGFENMLMDPYLNEHDFCCLRGPVLLG
jgi:hypothetical protein